MTEIFFLIRVIFRIISIIDKYEYFKYSLLIFFLIRFIEYVQELNNPLLKVVWKYVSNSFFTGIK